MNRFSLLFVIVLQVLDSLSLDDYVVGGKTAVLGQFPYQVSLETFNNYVCTGAILNQHFLITAAQCTRYDLWIARVGSLNHKRGIALRIKRVVPHPTYQEETNIDDVMLVELKDPVHFTETVQPVLLHPEYILGEVWGIASAYGNHSALEYMEFETIRNNHCGSENEHIPNSELCVQLDDGVEMSSNQDYGGPLVIGGKLAGLFSYHIQTEHGKQDVFTRVSPYVEWIRNTIKNQSS